MNLRLDMMRKSERWLWLIVYEGAAANAAQGEEIVGWRWHELSISQYGVGPFKTLQGLAAKLVARIKTLQPEGPYRLAAVGALGVLAYEMGIQLQGRGLEVDFVGLWSVRVWDWSARQTLRLPGLPDWLARCLADYAVERGELPLYPVAMSDVERRYWLGWAPAAWRAVLAESGLLATDSRWEQALAWLSRGGAQRILPEDALIVPLRPGLRAYPILLCVPGAGASMVDYLPLAEALSYPGDIYGLQPRGLDGEAPPWNSVEAMAAHFLTSIRGALRGPVHLLGHSFGGWVAHEIAIRMQGEGWDVRSLTMLDSRPPSMAAIERSDRCRLDVLRKLLALYQQGCDDRLQLGIGQLCGLDEEAQLSLLHQELVRVRMLSIRTRPNMLRGIVRTFSAAMRTVYRPNRGFSGRATLVLAANDRVGWQQDRSERGEMTVGWRYWLPQLNCRQASGNHVTMLKAPHVRELALQLDSRLAEEWGILV